MSTLRLIQIYQSPWSERARWGFECKGVPYEKEDYQVGSGEEEVKKLPSKPRCQYWLLMER